MSTKKLVVASLANLVIPLSGLVVGPLLSRELGPEGRGLYAALTLPIVVCGWIGTFGLQDALSFHLRDGRLSRAGAAKVSLLALVPLGLIGIALLGVLGLFVFADDSDHYQQFLLLSLVAPLHILVNLLIGALTGASDMRGVNLVKVVPALVRTGLLVFACLAFDLSAFWAGMLFLVSMVGGLVVGLPRLRSGRKAPVAPPEPTTIPTRSLLTYSLSCLPGVLAAISTARLDQIIGLPVIGAKELGYYAVAVSVAELPMVIATAARTVLMGRAGTDDPRAATQVGRLAVLASVPACGGLALIATFAVPWVFGSAFTPSVLPTLILCAGTTLYTCMVILSAVLLANGRPGPSSAALVAGSVAGVACLFLLAPLGAVGAALASLVGYGISVAVAAIAVTRIPGIASARMVTIVYREDLRLIGEKLRVLPLVPAFLAWLGRAGVATVGVGLLVVLAWLRVLAPQVISLFMVGRPGFNSRVDPPFAANLVGEGLSLAFLLVAAFLILHGLRRGRPDQIRWLPVVLAPFVAVQISGLVNEEAPSIIALALPLAAVAIWVQRPKSTVLGLLAVLGAVTAAGSILLALIRPDLGLLSGAAAGAKGGFFGGLLAGPLPHPNVLGIALALSLPFVVCIRNAPLRFGSLALLLGAVAWSGSRTSQLAVAAVVVAYLMRRSWLAFVPAAAGFLLIVFVPPLTVDPESFTERGRIWTALFGHWVEQPMLGFGEKFFLSPDLGEKLGGHFNHGHNLMVHTVVIGGIVALAFLALLLGVTWDRAVASVRVGQYAPMLFLTAFAQVSWLEASHVPMTLAGYATWLPLILIIWLRMDQPDPIDFAPPLRAFQKTTVSRR
ncbi:O-antigen ligase family protein [Polymorphospora rubra]|uniref:O-antigen ligase family protein n=1 Tax=Polymorphospora rubra TaxID=338584 RepID=UPI0033F6D8C0